MVDTNSQPLRLVITGASSGIGRAVAVEAASRGWQVVAGARRADLLDSLAREVPLVTPMVVDVADEAASRQFVRSAAQHLGGIDVMVANAGYGDLCAVSDYTTESLRRIFEVNVMGSWWVCAEAAGIMTGQQPGPRGVRGQLMMVSSAAARRGLPMFGPYSATKAAQLSLCEAWRVELKDQRIAVTTVHPVGTSTEFFDVAERTGRGKLPKRMAGDVQQSAEHVARRMCNAMARPCREVWPLRPARWMLGLACIWPGLADRVMVKARGQMLTGQEGGAS